jgi:hypothetical protein
MSLRLPVELVGGVLRPDPDAMRAVAQAPPGLRAALAILLLRPPRRLADALGDSPLRFDVADLVGHVGPAHPQPVPAAGQAQASAEARP